MLKIKDADGKTKFVLGDEDEEPRDVAESEIKDETEENESEEEKN